MLLQWLPPSHGTVILAAERKHTRLWYYSYNYEGLYIILSYKYIQHVEYTYLGANTHFN